MGKIFGVSRFTQSGSEPFVCRVEGTRFCLAKSSAPEICIDFGSGWIKMPRRGAVRLPGMVEFVQVKSVDGSPIRGELWYGEAEVDFSGVELKNGLLSVHNSYTNSTTELISSAVNTHGMTVHMLHIRGTLDNANFYFSPSGLTAGYGNVRSVYMPCPFELPPGEGLNVTNTNPLSWNAISMAYELH